MMFPLQLRPDSMLREMADFQSAWLRAAEKLRDIGEPELGAAPRDLVYQEEHIKLYHYQAEGKQQLEVPLLIVYALVNRPQIADLQDRKSLVQGLLQNGIDVYMLEWNDVSDADCFLGLDDYINCFMDRAVDFIRGTSGQPKINLLGICQGGTFSICYSALHPDKINALVPVVAPVDFHTPGDQLSHIVRHVDVELLTKVMGNIPGDVLNWIFLSLNPLHLMQQKYIAMADIADRPEVLENFIRMEQWIFDSPDLAGAAYGEFIRKFYQQNALVNDELSIGGKPVRLSEIEMPVCNVYASQDHLVPPASSIALGKLVGSESYNEISFAGGHIGIFVSSKAGRHIPPAIASWLKTGH